MTYSRKLFYLIASSLMAISIQSCKGNDGNPRADIGTSFTAPQPPNSENIAELLRRNLGSRHFYVDLPKQFNPHKRYKLLLAFHGSGGTAQAMAAFTQFKDLSEDYIYVYPQAAVEEWNEGCGCNKPNRLGIDDLAFVDDVITSISDEFNIFANEIYATGYSQGALFVQNLLCNRSERFNAIVSVASPMSTQLYASCDIKTPTDYLLIQGTNDTVLPYTGYMHSNFGLVSSEAAITRIAKQNNPSDSQTLSSSADKNISLITYQNEETTTQLVSVLGGKHQWQFATYDTSREIIEFFDKTSQLKIPSNSAVYTLGDKNFQIRTMGQPSQSPAIILLSGPNENYHADSAWYSLLQPYLAQQHRVLTIDRLGNGLSSQTEKPSYIAFAEHLSQLLDIIGEREYILVGFSSANISITQLLSSAQLSAKHTIVHSIWLDPDIITPEAVSLYQDYPVSWYREKESILLPHIQAGNWQQRTDDKLAAEKNTISALIPPHLTEYMDWRYFDMMAEYKRSISGQINRAKEIISYHDDLNIALTSDLTGNVPISIIDTDFESDFIEQAKENKEALVQWQVQGSEWSKQLATKSGGHYVHLDHYSHMVMFHSPEVIRDLINRITSPN